MKRFSLEDISSSTEDQSEMGMRLNACGEWVKWEDAKREIARLKKRNRVRHAAKASNK